MTFNLTFDKVLDYNKTEKRSLYKRKRRCNYISRIASGLYLSDWDSAENFTLLKKKKICGVLTINTQEFSTRILNGYSENDIEHKYVKAPDSEYSELEIYIEECYEFIRRKIKEGGVLIHCSVGRSRSPTVLLFFLLKYFYEVSTQEELDKFLEDGKEILTELYCYVEFHRPVIKPNDFFMKILRREEQKLQLKHYFLKEMKEKALLQKSLCEKCIEFL